MRLSGRAIFLAFSSVGLMAIWYPAMKHLLERVHPLQAAGIETLISIIWGSATFYLQKKNPISDQSKNLILIGLLNAFGTICLYTSLSLLDPVVNSLLGRNYSVFCVILAVFILHEKLTPRQWILIALSILGGVLFVFKETGLPSPMGIFLVTTYTVLYAVANVIAKKYCSNVPSSVTVFYIKVTSLFPIMIFGLASMGSNYFTVGLHDLVYIAVVSLITMYLGLNLFYKAIASSSFAYVNTIRSTGPIFVLVYSIPFYNIELTILNIVGGIITIVSVALLSMK